MKKVNFVPGLKFRPRPFGEKAEVLAVTHHEGENSHLGTLLCEYDYNGAQYAVWTWKKKTGFFAPGEYFTELAEAQARYDEVCQQR